MISEQSKKSILKKPRADYDSPWRKIMDRYFPDFMKLCWPEKYALIDWERGYKMLDQALLKIDKKAALGNQVVDKLVELYCRDGEVTYLILHIEIQKNQRSNFEQRMFQYRYRLRDLYDQPIASLAILIDNDLNWRPNVYSESLWGSSIEMRFPILKLADYREQVEDLKKANNRFAPVILAQLAANETAQSAETRLVRKIELTRCLYNHGWEREDILSLYSFLDWVLGLPEPLELHYNQEILNIEETLQVEYVTSAERVGMQKGLERGLEQGLEQGIQRGEGLLLVDLLEQKFGAVPPDYRAKIEAADSKTLLEWGRRLLNSHTLKDLFLQ